MATLEGNPPTHNTLGRYQSTWDALLSRTYAINWEIVLYVVIFVAAVITRFYDLGTRAMSHDESLHTFYSWRLFEDGDFQHTPLMHGPLLFHAVAFFYFLFGDSDFSARIYTALLGVLIVMFPLLFRRWLGRLGAIFASVGLLISPMMLYYSRYIRHDIPNIFFWLVMVYCVLQYIDGDKPRRPIWLYIFSGAMVLSLASKETAFIYIAIFGTFMALYWILRLVQSFELRDMHLFSLPQQSNHWRGKVLVRGILGHIGTLVVAVTLGYFIGYIVWYWHFASMGWAWVIVGTAGVLFLRLIALAWDTWRATWHSGTSTAVLNVILTAVALLSSLALIWGAVTYEDYNTRIDNAVSLDGTTPSLTESDRIQAALDVPAWEDQRALGTLVGIISALVLAGALTGLAFTYFLRPHPAGAPSQGAEWLINTTIFVLTVALALAVLRLVTTLDFPRSTLYHLLVIIALYMLLLLSGPVRTLLAGRSSNGMPMMLAEGLARGRSAAMIIIAGSVLGGVVAIYSYGVLDILKPAIIWCEVPDVAGVVVNENCNIIQGADLVDEDTPTNIRLDADLGNALLLWLGVPIAGAVVLVVLTAIFATPMHQKIPWTDVMAVLLVAVIVGGILKYVERHSFETEDAQTSQPSAIDPEGGAQATPGEEHDNLLLVVTVIGFLGLAAIVTLWRVFLPLTWAWFNRQPMFDVLILTGTLIVPWAVAFPIFTAGYELDVIPPPAETARVMILMLAAAGIFIGAVGLSWNPRVWTIAVIVFMALFVFFFTTAFTNGAGFLTGMVGSLGYWLEQQGVRRGSQPQYYYTLIQMPMYEFLPAILAGLAGIAGLGDLFRWRARRLAEESAAAAPREAAPTPKVIEPLEQSSADTWAEDERPPSRMIDTTALDDLNAREADINHDTLPDTGGERPLSRLVSAADLQALEDAAADDETAQMVRNLRQAQAESDTGPLDMDAGLAQQPDLHDHFDTLPDIEPPDQAQDDAPARDWARDYDHDEELTTRTADPEWLGNLPFLLFTAYWAILMLAGLSIAGEKMPWLTTHITLPLILLGSWFAGRVIERITPNALRGGWLLLVVLVPVLLVAGLRVLSPLMGGNVPFAGVQQAQLSTTYAWLGALLVFGAASYFIARLVREVGSGQATRLAFASVTLILALLTGRAAVMASYQNYDLATEYLVYAHASPRITTVMEIIDYYAERTNEGFDMRIAYDDQSSWPMTWYVRDYNSAFFGGTAEDLEDNPGVLDEARIVIVGGNKADAVERILGSGFYREDYVRLWWPMQEYFNLNYERVANLFEDADDNPAAPIYRQALWDIWWNRDYTQYGIAQCVESRAPACQAEENPAVCLQSVQQECQSDDRYTLERWPVSDRFSLFVDEEIAGRIWDAGLGGQSVIVREPQNAVDRVYEEVVPDQTLGRNLLNGPRGVAVGPAGNVYVADTVNNRVLVFTPAGENTQIIGRGAGPNETAGPETLFQPWGVAVGPQGNVYVADTWNHRVVAFTAQGAPLRTWGGYGTPEEGTNPMALWGPRDIAVDNAGNVIVADTGGKRLRVYTAEGEWLRDIGSAGDGPGGLEEPVGVAVNPVNDEIYVADTWNQRIQVFGPDGAPLRRWDVPMWYAAQEDADRPYIAVSPDGQRIAVSDMDGEGRNDGPRVVIYDLAGNVIDALNAPTAPLDAEGSNIRVVGGVAFGPGGTLYAVDVETGRLLRFPLGTTAGAASLISTPDAVNEAPAEGLGQPIGPPLDFPPSEVETFIPPGADIPRGVPLPGVD